MRRKDRERDRSFAWEVLKKAPYATLSLTDGQGRPYAVPVNQAVDEEYHEDYFHGGVPVGGVPRHGGAQRLHHGLCQRRSAGPGGGGDGPG